MRLIDADKLSSDILGITQIIWGGRYWIGLDTFERVLALQPSIDRDSVKQGHWVPIDDYPHEEWECDKCGFVYYEDDDDKPTLKYCPECGAKMEEESE